MSVWAIIFIVCFVLFVAHGVWAYGDKGPQGWGGHLVMAAMLGILGWHVFNL